jgi:hypothetical protein
MTPGHHALEVKIKSIEEEVELKINFAGEFRGGCCSGVQSRYETTRLERLEDSDEDS